MTPALVLSRGPEYRVYVQELRGLARVIHDTLASYFRRRSDAV